MRVLLVVAHPLDDAFAKAAAARIRATLERRGIEVDMIDLYADDFDTRLTGAERRGYFTTRPTIAAPVAGYVARLRRAEGLCYYTSKASYRMLTLYDMDHMTERRAAAFFDRLEQAFRRF